MEKLSPFQLILLAVFGFAAVLGLILFATYSGGGAGKAKVGTVVVWGTLDRDVIETELNTIAGEQEAYADVSYTQISESDFSNTVANAIASGSGPDLLILSSEQLLSETPKIQTIPFTSIPQRAYLDTYLPFFELFLTSEGTYGLPYLIDPLVLYYNRPILGSANIVSAPVSWEAVAGMAPSVTVRDGSGVISRSTIALGEFANIDNARGILSLLLLQSGSHISENTDRGVRAALGGERSFGSSPAEAAVSFYTQFADPGKSVYSWNRSLASSRQAFLSGDLALYLGFASERPALSESNPNLDFDMAPVPQPSTGTKRLTYGVGYVFALPKQSANPSGAFLAANALAESASMSRVAKELSMAPARRALLSADSTDRYTPIFYPAALTAEGWLSPTGRVTDGIFAGMIGNITSGRLEIDQAVSAAEQSLDASLR